MHIKYRTTLSGGGIFYFWYKIDICQNHVLTVGYTQLVLCIPYKNVGIHLYECVWVCVCVSMNVLDAKENLYFPRIYLHFPVNTKENWLRLGKVFNLICLADWSVCVCVCGWREWFGSGFPNLPKLMFERMRAKIVDIMNLFQNKRKCGALTYR